MIYFPIICKSIQRLKGKYSFGIIFHFQTFENGLDDLSLDIWKHVFMNKFIQQEEKKKKRIYEYFFNTAAAAAASNVGYNVDILSLCS